ncbi:Glutaredoxin [Coemansia sp. RSA 2322]|nr:Glutaredoxin [Coemansia sp. RSA 2322]
MGLGSSTPQHQISPQMSKIAPLVNRLINQNAVLVFSKTYCPYCQRAQAELRKNKIGFEAIELDTRKDGGDIQAYLLELTKQRTVPNIFANGHHVGGCDDTLKALALGSLQKLLKGEKGKFATDVEKPEQPSSAGEESGAESERAERPVSESPASEGFAAESKDEAPIAVAAAEPAGKGKGPAQPPAQPSAASTDASKASM